MASPAHPAPVPVRVAVAALCGLLLGTALQLQQGALFRPLVYAGLSLPALLLWAWMAAGRPWPQNAVVAFGLVLLPATLLGFSATGLRAAWFLEGGLQSRWEGRDLSVTGVVAAMPQRNEAGLRFRLEVESAYSGSEPVALPARIYLGWYAGGMAAEPGAVARPLPALQAGERWQLGVRLKAPHGASNPHGFDYELWLWEQGLQASGYVRVGAGDAAPRRLATQVAHPVERWRQQVRDAIFERVSERSSAGVLAALVVGDQSAIERADWDVFRATGVAHLMSISGLHITMFAWACALLLGWLWRRSSRLCLAWPADQAALLGGLLLASAYAVFSGWGVPSQRTCLMLLTVTLLRLSGRRWPWPHVWLLACAVVVLADPWALLQSGFWLSFVAVAVLFASNMGRQADAAPSLRQRVFASLREQWLITLALAPLSLLLFGQLSLVGLVANILAIPWVTLLVTPLALAGVLLAPFWDLAALCVQLLASYLQLLAQLPLATVSIAQPPLWAGTVGVLGAVLLVLPLPPWLRLGGLPLVLPVLLWQPPRPEMGQFELLAADIGQGNAVLVRTANHALVYDAGPRYSRESDAGHRMLVPLLRALDVRLDLLLLSHRDSDHTGGAPALLAMQPQAELLSSIEDSHELQALRPARRCEAGQSWNWDGVQFTLLHPQAADYAGGNRSNALSCVLRISNGSATALLVGDIEQPQEAALLAAHTGSAPAPSAATTRPSSGAEDVGKFAAGLRADMLLVPHHGSKTSSSAAFLDAVQPKVALVQAGYRNRFGHPAAAVMERYRERSIAVFDSPHCGAAVWDSRSPLDVRCNREEGRRYWHHVVSP